MSRLLLVEDSPENIQVVTAILKEQGHQVSVALNGRRALEVLAKDLRPDLILLDVMMPEVDGFETCAHIKASSEWRDIPIIFLTARTDPEDIVRGFELGALDYVAKPFNACELLARVNTHLAMHRLRQENESLIRTEAEVARHRSVAQMVAGVAHELNTPLGIINTAAGLISKWVSSPTMASLAQTSEGKALMEDLEDAAQLITRNITRAHKLVQDFKKVSVTQLADVREPCRLAEIVAETVHLFQVTAPSMQLTVTQQLPDPQGEWLGYPGALSQVLLNLLSNAQRYAYPDGRGGKVEIHLAADPEQSHYSLTVRDFGQGIPPENLPRIFDPFFTTGRAQGGSGLGMSIVYNVVQEHLKGSIAIESTPGAGTTVTLTFPREVAERSETGKAITGGGKVHASH